MKMIKKMIPASVAASVIALSTVAATPALAEVSANIGAGSNYLWRGVTQSADSAAISGGVDYANESGVFAGTWVSTIDGGNETDFYIGYGGESGDFGYSVTYNYYMYSQAEDADFGELLFDVSFNIVSAGLAYTVNDDAAKASEDTQAFVSGDMYYYIGVGTDLAEDWSWSFTYGMYDFDNDASDNEISYSHYVLDASKSAGDMGDFTIAASQVLDDEKDVGLDDDIIFTVSWSKGF